MLLLKLLLLLLLLLAGDGTNVDKDGLLIGRIISLLVAFVKAAGMADILDGRLTIEADVARV